MISFDPADPVTLTQALIRCPSVTPYDGGALNVVEAALKSVGFKVERPVFTAEGTADVENLYARYGTAAPVFVIAGHTDVVPPGDEAHWARTPFSGDIAEGLVHGRGACDMKGGLAAMISAAVRFVTGNPTFPGSIVFLVTGDEEGPAINGTVKLLEWTKSRGETFDHCLLGEPTNPNVMGEMIKNGRRGSLTGRLTVNGKQGHVAYPNQTVNPIRTMVALLAVLDASPLDNGTASFSPSNLEITTVDVGNMAGNVVPARANAVFNIRFNDLWTPQTLAAEITNRLKSIDVACTWDVVFDPTNAVAFLTQPGPFLTLLSEAITSETGRAPVLSTTGGTSDARFIKDYCEVVEFGTVGKTMHQVDESVAIQDLIQLERITWNVLKGYFQTT